MGVEVNRDNIWLNFDATNRADAIHAICRRLHEQNKTTDFNGLYSDIIRRERVVSTFAGHDTAIPHVISSHVDHPVFCFIRVSNSDLTWHGDSEKVTFIIFSAIPDNGDLAHIREQHSQVFAAIAQLLHTPEATNRWKTTNDEQLICDDLNHAFR